VLILSHCAQGSYSQPFYHGRQYGCIEVLVPESSAGRTCVCANLSILHQSRPRWYKEKGADIRVRLLLRIELVFQLRLQVQLQIELV